jgi:signal transduction histidine kinase/CheY-like chemotaxis protein
VTVTLALAALALRTSSPRRLDAILLAAIVALEAISLASASTRPRDFYMTVAIDVAVVNAIWTILPARFAVQVASAAVFLSGQVVLLRYFRDPLPVALRMPVILAYTIAHGVGAVVAWRYHRARRREWFALLRSERDREDLARAREAAERASRAKSVFLAGVSHEILTPLNAILGFSDVLRRRQPRPEDRRPLESIHAAAATLHGLLVDVLDMARGEATGTPPKTRPTDVRELLADVARIMGPRAHERGLEFEVEEGADLRVAVDADRLRQVLINLAANAVRFTQAGRISLSLASRGRDDGRVDLEIALADTGEGIPPEEHATIFEPFRQRRGQDARRYGGTGLGLSLSRQHVERMGGRIELESAVGRGSTFRVVLPGLAAGGDRPAATPSAWELPAATILVADDEPWNRDLVRSYLERQPVRVLEAEDGAAAVAAARAGPVEVAVLDLQMPGLDGLAAAERLRGEAGSGGPRIVIASAQPPGAAGPWDAWLRKPFDEAALLDALGPLLPGARRTPGAPPEPPGPDRVPIDPEWIAEAARLADAPHAGQARALADRLAAAARAAGDGDLEDWAAAVRASADALDSDGLRALLLRVGARRA